MPAPRWLTAEERESWVAFLVATRLLWSQFERDMQRGAGMPLTYYEILSMLSEQPERAMRMADLSTRLQVSPSRLSHAVSRLEEAGWVRRQLCPTDRRSWFSVLTDQGMNVVQSAAPTHVESVRVHLFDQLTPAQIRQLGEISTTLLAHLAPGIDLARERPAQAVKEQVEDQRHGPAQQ